jgi:hypothetical protein
MLLTGWSWPEYCALPQDYVEIVAEQIKQMPPRPRGMF